MGEQVRTFLKKQGALLLPLCLALLFYPARQLPAFMLWWNQEALPLVILPIRTVSGLFPFSLGEILLLLAIFGALVMIPYGIWGKIKKKRPFWRKNQLKYLCCSGLWLWVGMNWLWNSLYYVPSLAERGNIPVEAYSVEELQKVTEYFAQGAAQYAGQIPRDQAGNVQVPAEEYFDQALDLYQGIQVEFPFLAMENVRVKPFLCSCVQSIFGFTGAYIPFTGEANINVHSPSVLHPATIAHEMSHQRGIASELEANFLAVLACLDSSSPFYRYSGYLFGLIQLSNALYPVAPALWQDIVDQYFTPEISQDWRYNYEYWQQFQSPLEEVAKEVYDDFLKSNDQELGIRSYGACVDLLVAYYGEHSW